MDITLTLTPAQAALVHDCLDDHVSETRAAAVRLRDARPGQRADGWERSHDELWAEVEMAGDLRRTLARFLDGAS